MEELNKRPLVLAALALAAGIASHENLLLVLAVGAAVWLFKGHRARLALAASFALGAFLWTPPAKPLLERVWVEGRARVATVPRLYPETRTAEIQTREIRLLLTVPRGTALTLGDEIYVRGVAKPFREGTDVARLRRGVVGRIVPLELRVVREGSLIYGLGERWRASFLAYCERTLPPRVASIVAAVCFNVDTSLDPDDRAALSRSGTTHIVSASGLHVAMFAVVVAGCLSMLPIPRAGQLGVLMAVLLVYAAATGLRPPVVRAVFMAAAIAPAYIFRREPDGLSAIALAGLVQMVFEPAVIYDIGFQLSFVIIAALVLFRFESDHDFGSLKERLWTTARQGAVAMAASMPLLAYYFGSVSITALPANLLIALSIPAMMIGALAAHSVSLVWIGLGDFIMEWLVSPMVGWLFVVTDALGGEWAAPTIPHFSGYWVAAAYLLGLSLWRVRLRPA